MDEGKLLKECEGEKGSILPQKILFSRTTSKWQIVPYTKLKYKQGNGRK